ncbi:MAG: OmpA family protein [Cyanobacteria bacterium J06634_5]
MSTNTPRRHPDSALSNACAHRVDRSPFGRLLFARSLSLTALLFGAVALVSGPLAAQAQSDEALREGTSEIVSPDAISPDAIAPDTIAQEALPVQVPAGAAASVVSITVNSDGDGPITPDEALTLREAIEIANGTLPVTALSNAESALLSPAASPSINFALLGDTRIELTEVLPAITASGLTIDGTTQSGYGADSDEPAIVPVPVPAVSITPSSGAEVFRGITISADDVTVRGLSLYGFSSEHRRTVSTPPADIFISHSIPPQGNDSIGGSGPDSPSARELRLTPAEYEQAPKNVVIEDNWLGVSPAGGIPIPDEMSAFGVSVFNAKDAVVQRNRIEYHEGSGIITGALAQGLVVTENTIIGNGLAGMPDGIRFDGDIDGAQVYGNLMCANDGSGLYMFKPQGSASIYDNDIRFNGRRLRRPGVYLMGNGHEVRDNYIAYQPGPGVAIAAYPESEQNLIRNNQFRQLDGLSVDLTYNHEARPSDYQFGDGPNPPRNSGNRRRDSANSAINAPEFEAYVFPMDGSSTMVTGYADPGSEVDIYRVASKRRIYGELSELVTSVPVAEDGTFSVSLDEPEGTLVSAIATDARYGTSEPSPVAALGVEPPLLAAAPYQPVCQDPEPEPQPDPVEMEVPINLRIPRNIHFALDRSFISAESANILDQIAGALAAYPSLTIELQGHTDPRASNAYNEALGERRALSARDYLLQKGIAPERMRIRSFGESQLISTVPDVVDYARDRRVEFMFFDTRGLDITFEDLETDLQIE